MTTTAYDVIRCVNSSRVLDGSVVNTAGTYTTTLTSAITGCDSIVTTNLTVNPVLTSTANPVICTGSTYILPDGTVVNTTSEERRVGKEGRSRWSPNH